jgi:nucleoside-diphosphate-sugar epimerase
MRSGCWLITGATGFVGGHVAEACRSRGIPVVTPVRHASDTRLLEQLGVEIVRCELTDTQTLRRVAAEVEIVVHCAAKVGDWGPVSEYRAINVDGLGALLESVRDSQNLKRFVHMSTLGVYAARDHFGTDESVPPPERHVDGYTQSKVEAEKLALGYQRDHGVPVTILRPGFVYGPRDRTVLPRLMHRLEKREVVYLGSGEQLMNTIYVGNLVDAVFLAAASPAAVGQVYNLTDDEPVTKRRFFESIADLAGFERPRKSMPLWLARLLASVGEGTGRLLGLSTPPPITRAVIKFLGLNLGFSVEKAKRELGYAPRVKFEDGIEEAVAWWKAEQQAKQAPTITPQAEEVRTTPS